MPETEIELTIVGNDSKTIRDNLILEFLKEQKGTGRGDLTTKYYYYVETMKDGNRVYLSRPAHLNKGMDFEVRVDKIYFENENENTGNIRTSTRPSHPTILSDLRMKKEENSNEFIKLRQLIDKIYDCQYVADEEMHLINLNSGYSVELILKIIKWLFIEQDVTYWNWSGRAMFYSGIQEM